MESVNLRKIGDSAIRIAIRLALGEYFVRGAQDNVLVLESRVAWATVASELLKEGYIMVLPEEYAAVYGLAPTAVNDMIERSGSLFALAYAARDETFTLVPLAEREVREQLGSIPL